jgi:hypothetical protein
VGVNRSDPLCGNGFSIVAGDTCDDASPVRPGDFRVAAPSAVTAIRTRSSLRRFEAVGHRGKEVTV